MCDRNINIVKTEAPKDVVLPEDTENTFAVGPPNGSKTLDETYFFVSTFKSGYPVIVGSKLHITQDELCTLYRKLTKVAGKGITANQLSEFISTNASPESSSNFDKALNVAQIMDAEEFFNDKHLLISMGSFFKLFGGEVTDGTATDAIRDSVVVLIFLAFALFDSPAELNLKIASLRPVSADGKPTATSSVGSVPLNSWTSLASHAGTYPLHGQDPKKTIQKMEVKMKLKVPLQVMKMFPKFARTLATSEPTLRKDVKDMMQKLREEKDRRVLASFPDPKDSAWLKDQFLPLLNLMYGTATSYAKHFAVPLLAELSLFLSCLLSTDRESDFNCKSGELSYWVASFYRYRDFVNDRIGQEGYELTDLDTFAEDFHSFYSDRNSVKCDPCQLHVPGATFFPPEAGFEKK